MGSKSRIAKYIIPIMQAHRKEGMTWVEPFVGVARIDGMTVDEYFEKVGLW